MNALGSRGVELILDRRLAGRDRVPSGIDVRPRWRQVRLLILQDHDHPLRGGLALRPRHRRAPELAERDYRPYQPKTAENPTCSQHALPSLSSPRLSFLQLVAAAEAYTQMRGITCQNCDRGYGARAESSTGASGGEGRAWLPKRWLGGHARRRRTAARCAGRPEPGGGRAEPAASRAPPASRAMVALRRRHRLGVMAPGGLCRR